MSRIGLMPIAIPAGVTVDVAENNTVTVKGPKGTLVRTLPASMKIEQENGELKIVRPNDQKKEKALHGLTRALVHNMVVGVSEQFTIKQELVGVGYRVALQGKNLLIFSLGYSHDIDLLLPDEIVAEVPDVKKGENPVLVLKSCDKQLVGQVAAKVRSLRKPEPYKGKGIKFVGEQLRRKAGKTAAAK